MRSRVGSHNPATAPNNESADASIIAAAKPELKAAGEETDPLLENTATNAAMPNAPPRKRTMLKTPDALPISVPATEITHAFCAAGIAIETTTTATTTTATRHDHTL